MKMPTFGGIALQEKIIDTLPLSERVLHTAQVLYAQKER